MKKLFITFIFLMLAQLMLAQSPCVNSFTAVPVAGTGPSNAKLTVNTPACIGVSKYLVSVSASGLLPVQSVVDAGNTHTFEGLPAGTYSVTITDVANAVNKAFKKVTLTTSYRELRVVNIVAYGHTVRDMAKTPLNDGDLSFAVLGGTGIGPKFLVKIETPTGYTLQKEIARVYRGDNVYLNLDPTTVGTFSVTHSTNPIKPNKTYLLSGQTVTVTVVDLAGGDTSLQRTAVERVKIDDHIDHMPGSYEWDIYRTGIHIDPNSGRNKIILYSQTKGLAGGVAPLHRLKNPRNRVDYGVYFRDSITYTLSSPTRTADLGAIDYRAFQTVGSSEFAFSQGEEVKFQLKEKYNGQTLLAERNIKIPNFTTSPYTGGMYTLTDISTEEGCVSGSELAVRVNMEPYETRVLGTNPDVNASNFTVIAPPVSLLRTSSGYISGKVRYEVERKISGNWVAQTLGTHYTVDPADPTKIVIIPTADITGNRRAEFRITLKFITNAGQPSFIATKTIQLGYKVVAKNTQYGNFLKNLQKYYGIYEGTVALASSLNTGNALNILFPAKLKIQPVDGRTQENFTTRLPLMTNAEFPITPQTINKVFKYPIEVDLVPTSIDPVHGLDVLGVGDFPAGTYSLTIVDNCGYEHTERIVFDKGTIFTKPPTFKVVQDCQHASLEFDAGDYPYSSLLGVSLSLGSSKRTLFGKTGTFTSLQYGRRYQLTFERYAYVNIINKVRFDNIWSLIYPAIPFPHARLPYFGFAEPDGTPPSTKIEKEKVRGSSLIKETVEITIPVRSSIPLVSTFACDNTNGSGMVSIDLRNVVVSAENVKYQLLKEVWNGTETVTVEAKPSVSLPKATQYKVFTGVNNGKYIARVDTGCGSISLPVEVDSGKAALVNPVITSSAGNNSICPKSSIDLSVNLSDVLFNVEWYTLDPVTSNKTVVSRSSNFTTLVNTTTTYFVEASLNGDFNCPNTLKYTVSKTVDVLHDTTPPTVTSFPANITRSIPMNRCNDTVSWVEPTVTDTCSVTVSSSHSSPYTFDAGVHSVVYTFTDTSGNVTTRTLVITLTRDNLRMSVQPKFTNGGSTEYTDLQPGTNFFYEVRYKNEGENIKGAKLKVKLPTNVNLEVDGAPNFSDAGMPPPTHTYNSITKTYDFDIKQATLQNPIQERIIRIPLKIVGGHKEAGKPLNNILVFDTQMVIDGSLTGCPSTKTITIATESNTIEINTRGNQRTEVECSPAMPITAEAGFDAYQWYEGTTPIVGQTGRVFTPTTSGVYTVHKLKTYGTRTLTSYETIDFQPSGLIADPIKGQAAGLGVLCGGDGITWTSHFYLCDGSSKVLTTSFVNSALEWQKLKDSCLPLRNETCPATDDACWDTVQTGGSNFTLNTAGKYRLKASGGNCDAFFYFEVFIGGLSGQIINKGDKTSFFDGHITVRMATSGVTYNYSLKDIAGNIIASTVSSTTSREHRFEGLQAGTYTVYVTSPNIGGGTCSYSKSEVIDNQTTRTLKAEFVRWESCNSAQIKLTANGGNPPYQFSVWSIDGEQLYNDIFDTSMTWVGDQGRFDNHYIATLPITRIGEYTFVVRDQENGARAFSDAIEIVPPAEHQFTMNVTHIECVTASPTGAISLAFNQQYSRKVTLYRLDIAGNRAGMVKDITDAQNFPFTGLAAGNYEIEIETLVGTRCVYTKKPIAVYPPQNPLRAFAGIIKDKSCSLSGNYVVSINNVSGGDGNYLYSFNGEHGNYVTNPVGELTAGIDKVFVKDGKGCIFTMPLTLPNVEIPQVSITAPTYDCMGRGTVTVTVSATSASNFTYQIGNQTPTTQNVFILEGGIYTLTVLYTPSGTTQNELFREDFGIGVDVCATDLSYVGDFGDLSCQKNQALLDGKYAITSRVVPNSDWITPPFDNSGVPNARYLAIMASSDGIVYRTPIRSVEPNSELHLSADVINLMVVSNTANVPDLDIVLKDASNNEVARRNLGLVADRVWKGKHVTFTSAEIGTNAIHWIEIYNKTDLAGGKGNDFALDNIRVWQSINFCNTGVFQPVSIETGKALQLEFLSSTAVSCFGGNDGTIKVKVHNPPASGQYTFNPSDDTSWVSVTLDADNSFSVATLTATMSGTETVSKTIYYRYANNNTCNVSTQYIVTQPNTPISLEIITPVIMRCEDGNTASITLEAKGGNNAYNSISYIGTLTNGTTVSATGTIFNGKNATFGGLKEGVYTFTVVDVKGCATSTYQEIAPKKMTVTATIQGLEPNCYDGVTHKTIRVSFEGGYGGYEVQRFGNTSWERPLPGEDFVEYSGLRTGTYTFTVMDVSGCKTQTVVTIFDPLTLTVSKTSEASCNTGVFNTIFVIKAVGGDTSKRKVFTIYRDGSFFREYLSTNNSYTFTTPLADMRTGATYEFEVKYYTADIDVIAGESECVYRSTTKYVIPNLPIFAPSVDFRTIPSYCGGYGSIIIDKPLEQYLQAGGNVTSVTLAVYEYPYAITVTPTLTNWLALGGKVTPTSLNPGVYAVILQDARGCYHPTAGIKLVEVKGTPKITASITTTPISCKTNNSTASITLSVGGHETTSFDVKVFLLGQATPTTVYSSIVTQPELPKNIVIPGLQYGDYEIVIEDRNTTCQTRERFSVGLPPNTIVAEPNLTPTACGFGTGNVTITTYNTDGTLSQVGNYIAIYREGISTSTVGVNPEWHLLPPPHNGVAPDGQTASITSYHFTGLIPGVRYEFIIHSVGVDGGCTLRGKAQIPVPTRSTLTSTVVDGLEGCVSNSSGRIDYVVKGWANSTSQIKATLHTYPDITAVTTVAPAILNVNGTMTQTSGFMTGLPAGSYVLVFEEVGGCITASENFFIRNFAPLQINAVTVVRDKAGCVEKGEIRVDAVTGGLLNLVSPPILYMVRPTTEPAPATRAEFVSTGTTYVSEVGSKSVLAPAGDYYVYMIDNAGCIVQYPVVQTIHPKLTPTIATIKVDYCNVSFGKYRAEVQVNRGESSVHIYNRADLNNPTRFIGDTFMLTELSPGTYTVSVYDIEGCGVTQSFVIGTPIQPGIMNTVSTLSCATPTVTFNVSGITAGTGTYTFELLEVIDKDNQLYNPVHSQVLTITSGVATSVTITQTLGVITSAKEYIHRVYDIHRAACPEMGNYVLVDVPRRPFVSPDMVTLVNVSCYGSNQGQIIINATEPASLSPMTFKIISKRDGTNSPQSVTITPTSTLSNAATFSGLEGTLEGVEYTIEIKGNNGCVGYTTQRITSPAPISVANVLTASQFTCGMSAALTAKVHFDASRISGGIPPYTWAIYKTGVASPVAENLSEISIADIAGGTFYAEVRDSAGGCSTQTAQVTINPAFTIEKPTIAVQQLITCLTDEKISVTAKVTPSYIANTPISVIVRRLSDNWTITETYSNTISGATTITHTLATLLPTGEYEITLQNDHTQCGRSKEVHKVDTLNDKFTITFSEPSQPSCYRGDNGQIVLTMVDRKPHLGGNMSAMGFVYTITYLENGSTVSGTIPAGTASLSVHSVMNLKEGTYRVDATSLVNGCSITEHFMIPSSAPRMIVRIKPSPTPEVSCVTNKGNILATITGGKAPYQITLTGATTVTRMVNASVELFDNLDVGTYTISVVDALGCTTFSGTVSTQLLPPTPLTASVTITNVTCKGENNGKISVSNIRGGSGSNVFILELDNGIDPKITQTATVVTGLKPTTYTVTITDGLGCFTRTTIQVKEPDYLEAEIDLVNSDRLVCYGMVDGSANVRIKGGVQPYRIEVYDKKTNRKVTPNAIVTPPPADPSLAPQIAVQTAPELAPGTYYVKVTDANNCQTVTTEFTVEEAQKIEPRDAYQLAECKDDVLSDPIVVRFSNGVDFSKVSYELNGVAGNFDRTEGNLAYIFNYDRSIATQSLTFVYTFSHSDGTQRDVCKSDVWTIDIQDIKALTVTEVTNLNLNTIEVKSIGGVAPYTYSFNGVEQGSSSVYVLKYNDPGYTDETTKQIIKQIPVQVVDALGCTYSITITKVYYDIIVPNFFTPDGDGLNDTWSALNIATYENSKTHIYDRNGRKITTLKPVETWDGTYKGKPLPSGDYWYVIELYDADDLRKFYGNFTLYR